DRTRARLRGGPGGRDHAQRHRPVAGRARARLATPAVARRGPEADVGRLAGGCEPVANSTLPMEHAVQFEPVSPWRTTAIAATGVAALELVAPIVPGPALHGQSDVSHRRT